MPGIQEVFWFLLANKYPSPFYFVHDSMAPLLNPVSIVYFLGRYGVDVCYGSDPGYH